MAGLGTTSVAGLASFGIEDARCDKMGCGGSQGAVFDDDIIMVDVNEECHAYDASEEDITRRLLEYDWRTASNHPHPRSHCPCSPTSPECENTVREVEEDWASVTDNILIDVDVDVDECNAHPSESYDGLDDDFTLSSTTGPQLALDDFVASASAGFQDSSESDGDSNAPSHPGDGHVGDGHIEAPDEDFVALVERPTLVWAWPQSRSAVKRKASVEVTEIDIVKRAKIERQKAQNRASASTSRARKKAHLAALHRQIDELTAQNRELIRTCQDVAEDNASLRRELNELEAEAEFNETATIGMAAKIDETNLQEELEGLL